MLFVLVFVLWAAAELFVAIKVADAIGVLATVVLLLLSWPIGSWALRSQGRAAWRRLGAAVSAGRSPGREVLDGALVVIGGVLLIVPGFLSDVLGALALLPPTRALTRRLLARNIQSRFVVSATQFSGGSRPNDVDSTATDIDQPQLHP
ncbi:MAG TPA: FxsA family protein [Solirubrobacteraceae bacterium]|nr:FxsA family protein [Solirubrobacteraceae bacterium]